MYIICLFCFIMFKIYEDVPINVPIKSENDFDTESTNNDNKFKLDQKEFDENELLESIKKDEEFQTSMRSEHSTQQKLADTSLAEKAENELNDEENALPIEFNDEWRTKSKHVFILSEAGKPIYSL
jgi:hypothetical protein